MLVRYLRDFDFAEEAFQEATVAALERWPIDGPPDNPGAWLLTRAWRKDGNVAKACELLEVSRSAYYEWSRHVPSRRQLDDEALGKRIQAIYDDSRGTYGWPRVHRACRPRAPTPAASACPGSCATRPWWGRAGGAGPRRRVPLTHKQPPTTW
ncbi:MAG TPA: hypothetical protein VK975_01390 [Acidimicrobiales bacterium]|nr:hypothetical protein [Acidimicrobiales bacterium]